MRVIQVRVSKATPDVLADMEDWLTRESPLVRTETASDENATLIKVTIEDDALAEAFRREFGGTDAG